MSTPMDKLKGIINEEIKVFKEDIEKLKGEGTKVADFEARVKTLEDLIKEKETEIKNLEKIVSERAIPPAELPEAGKGGFKSFGDYISHVKAALIDKDSKAHGKLTENNERMKAPTSSNSQSALVGSEGRFLVPETFANQLLGDMNQYGAILSKCFQLPVSGQIVRIPALVDYDHSSQTYYSAVSVSRGIERAQISGAAMDFGQVKLELKKLVGLAGMTNELIRWSAISVEPILRRVFASAMAAKIERELIKGTGAGEMLGFINSPCILSQAVESGQTSADTLLPENITHMVEQVPIEATGPAWVYHNKMLTSLMLLNKVIGAGGSLVPWFEFGNNTLLTYPMYKSEFCNAPNAAGDIFLVDLPSYIYAYEAGGEQVMTSPHFYFDYDSEAIRFTMYNDGQFWWKSSRLLDDGASYVSPCIDLAVRS